MTGSNVVSISMESWRSRTCALSSERNRVSNLYSIAGPRRIPAAQPAVNCRGCAMSDRFLAVAFAGSTAWFGSRCLLQTLTWSDAIWRVLAVSCAAAMAGKALGTLMLRIKNRKA